MTLEELRPILLTLLGLAVVGLMIVALLFWLALRQVRNLHIPPDATFAETLRLTPFVVVLMIDILDLSLDFLAAPVAWVLLDRLGLKALRGVSFLEGLIPGTQLIPTMTLAWIGVRLFNIR